jgi:NADH dehydrogenase [ubiquinone] 1 alpha subcomplex assembly factor 7
MSLFHVLQKELQESGPITLQAYMRRALTDPTYGYYIQRQPLGSAGVNGGDFTTAPEISQMFGELLGAWCADLWHRMDSPAELRLVELGPGRGTLMADILRAASVLPAFSQAVEVHFVEISPTLRALQAEKVPDAHWHDDLAALPASQGQPMIVLANEFFDALPIQQFRKTDSGWDEMMVAEAAEALVFTERACDTAPFSPLQRLPEVETGDIVEVCPDAEQVMRLLADKLTIAGGAALIIDYGYSAPSVGDSFQALHRHTYTDPLANPGEADLTAHVNFSYLRDAATTSGLAGTQIVQQGAFLQALGLDVRAQALCASSPDRQRQILAERDRLAAADQMGHLFKVLGLASASCPPLAGF